MDLTKKHCVPCEGNACPLTPKEISSYNKDIAKWQVMDNKKLKREFSFKNFKEAMGFVNKVAELAEDEGHHPDILVHDYKKVTITLSTHAIHGLSENDMIEAAKID